MSIDNNFSAPKSRSLPTPTNQQDIPGTLAAWKSQLGPLIKNSNPPAPPVNFRVTNARGGLQLSWSPVQGADGYEVLKSLDGSFTDDLVVIPLSGASNTNHFDSLGGSATTAHYRIRTTTGDPRRGPETGTVSHTSLDANDTNSAVTTFSDQFTNDRTRASARLGNYGAIKSSSLGLATGGSGTVASSGTTGSTGGSSGGSSGISSLPFSAVTSGENLSSAMVVGQDASIRPDPTIPGVIDATDIQGTPVSTASPVDGGILAYSSTDAQYDLPSNIFVNPGGAGSILPGPSNATQSLGSNSAPWNAMLRNLNSSEVFADAYPGADIGAKINNAIADLGAGGGTVRVPAGTFSYATTIQFQNGIVLRGMGAGSTNLSYTGATIAVNMSLVNHCALRDIEITVTSASEAVHVAGSCLLLENFWLNGPATSALLRITGDQVSSNSSVVWIRNGLLNNFSQIGISIDHCVDTFVSSIEAPASTNSTTATALVVDTGTSGLYINGFSIGYGKNGLKVQNTNTGGAYGPSPKYLFFNQFLADTTTGGDAVLFDSTLATNIVSAHFDNCWAANAGKNASGTIVTAGANGLHISGGQGIYFGSGRIRFNAGNGVFIDNANVKNVRIDNNTINDNDFDNTATQHGINVTVAATDISIVGNRIGNGIESGGGSQRYGINLAAVLSDHIEIVANNLAGNNTGTLLNASTGTFYVWANGPAVAATGNIIWGDIVQGSGNVSLSGSLTVAGATPTGSGSKLGLGNTVGFGNGAAATPVTTTALGTGSGPTNAGVIVKYLEVDLGGTKFWIPLCQ